MEYSLRLGMPRPKGSCYNQSMASSFPPYSFVPGYWPHPTRDTDGHSFNHSGAKALPLDPKSWTDCPDYLRGIELFDNGYYWEAHESWEGVWLVLGRKGDTALLLKALIKLAAVGVKVRQQAPGAARSLLGQVQGHLTALQSSTTSGRYAGLHLEALGHRLSQLHEKIEFLESDPELPVQKVLPEGLLAPQ